MKQKFVPAVGRSAGLCCALLVTLPARAQNTDGAVRLHLDGTVFTGELAKGGDSREVTITDAGLLTGAFGVGLGYAPGKSGVIGIRALHGSRTYDDSRDTLPAVTSTRLVLLPYGEYVIALDSPVQPFFSGMVGFQVVSAEAGEAESSGSAFTFGVSAGLRVFGTESFSIDPQFTFLRSTGSSSEGEESSDYSANTFLLGFSVSGWLGGRDERELPPGIAPVAPGASVATPSAPAKASSASLAVDEKGESSSAAVSLGAERLTLTGRPALDAEHVVLRVAVNDPERKLESCRSVSLLSTGGSWARRGTNARRRYDLRDTAVSVEGSGATRATTVQGTIRADELLAFAEAKSNARLAVCGHVIHVGSGQREAIREFVESFRQRAREPRTTTPPPAVAPVPPAPTPALTPPAPAPTPAPAPAPAAPATAPALAPASG